MLEVRGQIMEILELQNKGSGFQSVGTGSH